MGVLASPSRTGGPLTGRTRHPGVCRLTHLYSIQKHAARRLHYDLRLELGGVLKSWALPKGPSLVPGERRLAVEVEDHRLDYINYEGIIPDGSYGAGAVLLWDRGTWEPADGTDPLASIASGSLPFRLHGRKLTGSWRLSRMRQGANERQGANKRQVSWLLVKARDEAARSRTDPDILIEEPFSVLSGKTVEEVVQPGSTR